MTPERWSVVKSVFAAVDAEPARRASILEERCGPDRELRDEVERLLDSVDASDTADVRNVVAAAAATLVMPDGKHLVGRQLGPYRIVGELGSGGMGTVYEAVREHEFEKRVAIKAIRNGLRSDDAVRRFENERQILAHLEHANIARLLDGGTTADGVPYLVMELVDGGVPLDRYCAERDLPIQERLRLFLDVCAAVQYAHQHLVIHRDLKPNNVLVRADGVPKLVDFGISKVMEPDGESHTVTEFRAMTPEYASPEQIAGRPITTSSDVYSLGVMLFRLLTGTTPYDVPSGTTHDVTRAILEQEPRRPSDRAKDRRVARQLSGDLDNIVLMALRKDPARRYASAQQLAQDVERYLDGRTVSARPDTFGYRTARFIARYRVASSMVALLSAGLIGSSVFAVQQAVEARESANRARAEQRKAERRFNDVRKLARALLFEFDEELSVLAGSTKARELVVTNALAYLDGLSHEADDPTLRYELATAYMRVGEIQGNPYASNLGKLPDAERSYAKAVALADALHRLEPRNARYSATLASALAGTADVLYQQGNLAQAAAHYRKSLANWTPLTASGRDVSAVRSRALVHAKLGDILGNPGYSNLGDRAGAAVEYAQAISLRERVYASQPSDSATARDLSEIYTKVGYFYSSGGDLPAAAASYAKATAILEKLVAQHPNVQNYVSDLSLAYMLGALPLRDIGKPREALDRLQRAGTLMQRLLETDPASTLWPRNLAVIHNHLSATAVEAGDFDAAVRDSAQAVQISENLRSHDLTSADAALDLAIALRRQSDALYGAGRIDEALSAAQRGLSLASALKDENNAAVFERAACRMRAGRALAARNPREAERHLETARAQFASLLAANPGNVRQAEELSATLLVLASLQREGGRNAEACRSIASAHATLQQLETGGKARAFVKSLLARSIEMERRCGR